MPQMTFDLEDGQEPVSFALSNADSKRFMDFMADCTDAIRERQELLSSQERLQSRIDELAEQRESLIAHLMLAKPMIEAYRSQLGGDLMSLDDEEQEFAEEAEQWLESELIATHCVSEWSDEHG